MRKFCFFLIFVNACLYSFPYAYASNGENVTFKFVFACINFAIFFFVLYRFGLVKLFSYLKSRGVRISKDIEEGDKEKENAFETYESLKVQLEKITEEITRILGEAQVQGEKLKREILGSAKYRSEMILKESKLLIERETQEAEFFLRRSLLELSTDLAEAKIKRQLGKTQHKRLIENCIKQLEDL